jgi:hypothetical protein
MQEWPADYQNGNDPRQSTNAGNGLFQPADRGLPDTEQLLQPVCQAAPDSYKLSL